MRDRGVREEPDDVALLERREVAERHRQDGHDAEHRGPHVGQRLERHEAHLEKAREPGRLRRHRQERRHRHGRALVRVRRPEVERHGGHLEPEPDDHEQHAREQERRALDAPERGRDTREVRRAGVAVHDRQAEQQHRDRQHTDQEELQRALVRAQVELAQRRHDEARNAHELERDEDHHEVARARHEHHADERGGDQEVVLTLVRADLGEVAVADEQHEQRDDEEERLEQQRVAVHDEHVAERGPRGPVDRQGDHEPERDERPDERERVHEPLALAVQEQLDEQDRERRREHAQLGREREPVDAGQLVGVHCLFAPPER
jgi:hypothetical protein